MRSITQYLIEQEEPKKKEIGKFTKFSRFFNKNQRWLVLVISIGAGFGAGMYLDKKKDN
jgi:hypothetical protein